MAIKTIKKFLTEIKNNVANFSFEAKEGRLWSPEIPYLYDLILELKINDKIVEQIFSQGWD